MICPFKTIVRSSDAELKLIECAQGECALWDEMKETCCLHSIATNLEAIADGSTSDGARDNPVVQQMTKIAEQISGIEPAMSVGLEAITHAIEERRE